MFRSSVLVLLKICFAFDLTVNNTKSNLIKHSMTGFRLILDTVFSSSVSGSFSPTCLHLSSAAFLSVSACSARSMAFSLSSFSICIFFLMASMATVTLNFAFRDVKSAAQKVQALFLAVFRAGDLALDTVGVQQNCSDKRESDRSRRGQTGTEQRWRVELYKGSYLNCSRTCLLSPITRSST